MAQHIKDESMSTNNVKMENSEMMGDIEVKQEQRRAFDIIKNELEQLPNEPKEFREKLQTNAEEFKKFILACIWEKRIPKHEIVMMNLIQNVAALSQAIKDDTIPLKQATKILMGLQKVYQRKMAYLNEDSKYLLNQLESPFKDAHYVKGESEEAEAKKAQ